MPGGISIDVVTSASLRPESTQNANITVTTSVFNAPLPAGRWRYVELDIGTSDAVVAIAIDEDPSVGSGTDGNMSWGVGCAKRGVSSAVIPLNGEIGLSDDNELRLISDTVSTDVVLNIFAN